MRSVVLVLLAGAVSAQPVPRGCLEYEPSVVHLRGRIERRTFPGPPNYMSIEGGDQRDVQWILVLRAPACVDGKGGDELKSAPEVDLKEMQLVVANASDWKRYGPLAGKDVLVTGTLYHAHTAHHRTRVLLTVQLVEAQLGRPRK